MSELLRLQEETKKMLRSVLLPNKEGLLLSDLEREFLGMVGYSIPWRRLGHLSLLDMVRSMPGVVVVETLGKGHMLLHAAPDQSTRHIADLVSKQYDPFRKVGCGYNQHTGYVLRNLRDAPRSVIPPREEPPSVPPGVEKDITKLLESFPSGLLASRLLFEHRLFHGRELNMGGFSTILQLLVQLSDSIDMQQEGNLGDWRLKLLKKEEEEMPWYSQLSNKQWVDLVVLRVKSPGDLCVIPKALRGEVGRIQEEVCAGKGSSLTSIYLGQRVAAARGGASWARAEVVEIGSGQVKLFFIDLGEQGWVPQEDLRELPKNLLRKPPLALRTGLADVSPPFEGTWSKETCRRLKTEVRDAMNRKGSIEGKLHQVESLPWPLLDLKSDVVHINDLFTEKVVQDVSSSSLLNICHTSPAESRNKQRPLVGDLPSLSPLERTRTPLVEGVKEVSKLVTLSSAGEEQVSSGPNLFSAADILDEMLGLVEQIKSAAWQKIRGEEEGGQRVAMAALQNCLASLESGADAACSTQINSNRRDTVSTKYNGLHPLETKVVPVLPPLFEKQEREASACKEKDNKLTNADQAKSGVEVTPCMLHSGEGENKVTVHLLRLEQGGESWCSSKEVANLLPHWGGRDLVNKMLKVKRIEMAERLIKKQEHARVFTTLAEWGVRGANIGEEELVMYKLKDLPIIMKAFRVAGLKEVLADLDEVMKEGERM